MLSAGVPITKELVLLGGGHSHVEVLRSFGMKPVPGTRLTLVTRDVHTPYSGMLPGYVSGFYEYDECHIDLRQLAAFAGARFLHAEASGIDLASRRLMLSDRPHLQYDVLSINTGITPDQESVPGAREYTTAVKPVNSFIDRFHQVLAKVQRAGRALTIAVVGGGAGGVELALAVHHRLEDMRIHAGKPKEASAKIRLVTRGKILATHIAYVRRTFLKVLEDKGVALSEDATVERVSEGELLLVDGSSITFDVCLWCTDASAASWTKLTGLKTDDKGFLLVNDYLQADDGPPEVFAAGDVATNRNHPRPKAGVFAVRQGAPLAVNLKHFLQNKPLVPFTPQSTFLSLISTGEKYCVASKGWFGAQGAWLWTVKDYIDRQFMTKYGTGLPSMGNRGPVVQDKSVGVNGDAQVLAEAAMRCAGCGGKVGRGVLTTALSAAVRLGSSSVVVPGYEPLDDAAVIKPPPPGHVLLQTVDFLRSCVDDPYLFGVITANHCLSDIYAMGGNPESALAVVTVPYASDSIMQADVTQVMAGANYALNDAGCAVVGGHTAEGGDLALGVFVHGTAEEHAILRKGGMVEGQALILTKPLGTGTIMAAAMRRKARGRWVTSAVETMRASNGGASDVFKRWGATACTDVTGFGLLGHLWEMTEASKVGAELYMDGIPVIQGAKECLEQGIFSSIHRHNKQASAHVVNAPEFLGSWRWNLLVDPQTGGGLLASLPEGNAAKCLLELQASGYNDARIIGTVLGGSDKIRLRSTAPGLTKGGS